MWRSLVPEAQHIGNRVYDADANREGARKRGIVLVIPYRSSANNKPRFFPRQLYKGRARIEQAIGKLKCFKHIALRCEKIAQNYGRPRRVRLRPHPDQIRPHGLKAL
jgi:hypothetical protein